MNYVMTNLPMDHEKTIALFAERALNEAYNNGRHDGHSGPQIHTEIKKRY